MVSPSSLNVLVYKGSGSRLPTWESCVPHLHAYSAKCMTGITLFARTILFYIFGLRAHCPKNVTCSYRWDKYVYLFVVLLTG